MRRRTKSYFHLLWCHADTGGQKCAKNYEPTLITHNFLSEFLFSKRSEGFSLTAINLRLWVAGSSDVFALTVATLNIFFYVANQNPFLKQQAEVFKSFCERAFFSSFKHPHALALLSCAQKLVCVCLSNQRQMCFCRLSLYTRRTNVSRESSAANGLTSLLMKRGGIFSGLQSLLMSLN